MSAYSLINPAMNRLLHSAWHKSMSGRIMAVSYKGRKSGKDYTTPVSYYRDGNTVYCFTNGSWRFNFVNETPATLRLRGEDYESTGVILQENRARQADIMTEYFKAVPQDKKFYGVKCDSDGEPVRSQVEQAMQVIEIIRFEIAS